MARLGWGILGAGEIARDFTRALTGSPRHRVVHVASRSLGAARALASAHAARHSDSLAALLDDREVDALYVATPHTAHEHAALEAISRGKPALIEKPLCPDPAAVERVVTAARARGVLLREGYMYRCHPLLARVAELVRTRLGTVHFVRADFGFHSRFEPEHRNYRPELAGGGIWDVGGYPATFAQWVAGLNLGLPFAAAEGQRFAGRLGPSGVDVLALAQLEFPGGLLAQLGCSIQHPLGTRVELHGEGGRLSLEDPWLPSGDRQGTRSSLELRQHGREPERVEVEAAPVFLLEADSFRDEWLGAPAAPHVVTLDESLVTSRLLAHWRRALG